MGVCDDVPVPGHPSDGIWSVIFSSTNIPGAVQWGIPGDVPVTGDYDGDGRTDFAVFRPSTGVWYVVNSATARAFATQWGDATDVPVPSDF